MSTDQKTVTALLQEWNAGDSGARDELMPLVYEELRRIAEVQLRRERPHHTLQTTALVHEAYLKLVGQSRARWLNRAQFFGVAAQLMRRVLVDWARGQRAAKRGGDLRRITLEEATVALAAPAVDLLDLDAALSELEKLDQRKARLVELRFFGGLEVEEAAEALELSSATVGREWRKARAWLYDRLVAGASVAGAQPGPSDRRSPGPGDG